MTEKRFTIEIWQEDSLFYKDDKEGFSAHNSIGYVTNLVENKLNELSNENEQLRHDATVLIQSNQEYRKENEQLKKENKQSDEIIIKLCDKLEEENINYKFKLSDGTGFVAYEGRTNIHKDCENYSPKKDYCLKFFKKNISSLKQCQEKTTFNDNELQRKWSN